MIDISTRAGLEKEIDISTRAGLEKELDALCDRYTVTVVGSIIAIQAPGKTNCYILRQLTDAYGVLGAVYKIVPLRWWENLINRKKWITYIPIIKTFPRIFPKIH